MYRVFKLRQALLNGAALLVVAAGMIAGSGFKHGRWFDTLIMQRSLGEGLATLPPPDGS